ncbi:MAG: cytochrome c [Thermoflavifilum sp.]|nr:cytochrome c [Thermoflavifilum sp.]
MEKRLKTLLFLLVSGWVVGCHPHSTNNNHSMMNNNAATNNATSSSSAAAVPANPMDDKGIGPVKSVELGPIQPELVKKGEQLFNEQCTACHRIDSRYIGPALKGVTKRQSPEWIMNMILNPDVMIQQDPIAKQLVSESNGAVMANLHLSEDQARALLEYFRSIDDTISSK